MCRYLFRSLELISEDIHLHTDEQYIYTPCSEVPLLHPAHITDCSKSNTTNETDNLCLAGRVYACAYNGCFHSLSPTRLLKQHSLPGNAAPVFMVEGWGLKSRWGLGAPQVP